MLLRLTKHWQFTSKSPDSWGSVSFVDEFLFGQTSCLNCLINLKHELCIDQGGTFETNEKYTTFLLIQTKSSFQAKLNFQQKWEKWHPLSGWEPRQFQEVPNSNKHAWQNFQVDWEFCWSVLLIVWLVSSCCTVLLILYRT